MIRRRIHGVAILCSLIFFLTSPRAEANNPCSPGVSTGQNCAEIPNWGCCDGTNRFWCNFSHDMLCTLNCSLEEPGCGDTICADDESPDSCPDDCTPGCGNTNCGLFESTTNCPKDCGTLCGDGACNGEETPSSCPSDCTVPAPYCGWDTESEKLSCLAEPNEQTPFGSVNCQQGGDPCLEPGFAGCCGNGHTLTQCVDGESQTVDCQNNGDPNKNQCGWLTAQGVYGCTTLGLAEPSGVAEFLCADSQGCAWDCEGKQCGSDSCGGICGVCPEGTHCEGDLCVCTPVCDGLQCGPDSCEGSCGDCPEGLECNMATGQCQDCVADCSGRECGSDGCGGSCGDCLTGQVCNFESGTCEGNCTTLCDTKECGDDGCGGSCGECGPGRTCILAGICVSIQCITECEGLECGINSCGDPCGVCPSGTSCSSSGFCIEGNCLPACTNRHCGPDGCGGLCGQCDDLEVCLAGLCVPQGNSGPDSGGGFGEEAKGSSGCTAAKPQHRLTFALFLLALFSLRRKREVRQ